MPSTYPTSLDSFSTTRANSTVTATTHPADHNNANDAINRIEGELGINPSGTYSTVLDRLNAILDRLNAIQTAPNYTTTNVITTRTIDANTATLDTISDVLGSLINDLVTAGILS